MAAFSNMAMKQAFQAHMLVAAWGISVLVNYIMPTIAVNHSLVASG